MSVEMPQTEVEDDEKITIEYGDTFRHIITDEVRTVHDAREDDEKVTWVEGGWDYREELEAAIRGETSLYEVENRGGDVYEGAGY